jgi:hypothetical protein
VSAFGADWLRLREPFDAAARSGDLARRFGAALAGRRGAPLRIVDLAAGSGANLIALAPAIGGDQDWLLMDNDPALLAAQAGEIARWSADRGWRCRRLDRGALVEAGDARWSARAQRADLSSVEALDLAGCDGVTASAFFDLVSEAWLDRLCAVLGRDARPFLATLTVDGRREWHPAAPGDAHVRDAFARHQARDKGFGPALGFHAVSHLARGLAALGYAVSTARSDWRIVAEHRDMLALMVEGTVEAASEAEPSASALFSQWSEERRAQIRAGALTLEVGHLDLLALPTGS